MSTSGVFHDQKFDSRKLKDVSSLKQKMKDCGKTKTCRIAVVSKMAVEWLVRGNWRYNFPLKGREPHFSSINKLGKSPEEICSI